MRRGLRERRREPQGRVAAEGGVGVDRGELRPAGRQRARLVEQHRPHAGQPLQRAAALHDDAAPCGAADPRHERDRRGEDQRAGRRDHEHGERAHRIARHRPRAAGEHGGEGDEAGRPAVGEPREGRARLGRLPRQAEDRGVGARGGVTLGAAAERRARVHPAAAELGAAPELGRQGFPGEGALVEGRGRVLQRAVGGDGLAGAHQQQVARADGGGLDLLDASPRMRAARRGARATRSVRARVARPSAQASSASPPATMRPMTAAAAASPSATAPSMAARATASTPMRPPSTERTSPSPTCAATGSAAADQIQAAGSGRPSRRCSTAPAARPVMTQARSR